MAVMLPEIFLCRKPFLEHQEYYDSSLVIDDNERKFYTSPIFFKGKSESGYCCFSMNENGKPFTSYFIGVDWLNDSNEKAVYIHPKLNRNSEEQVDYVKMLFALVNHPDTFEYMEDVFEIKWKVKPIEINEHLDHLTPLLVVQYLQVVKRIVRKGLKKSYYKVERNLYAKVKGKVMVSDTIKRNLIKNKQLNTYCAFDEFGVNGIENRLLKKALIFVQRYLNNHNMGKEADWANLFNYVNAAFADVSDEVSLNEVKDVHTNAFYKDYKIGIELARRILKKFGYNITNTEKVTTIETPPFWIDMSKLFELYVLGLLKDKVRSTGIVEYHFGDNRNELDFLLNDGDYKMVVDAKYKPRYERDELDKEQTWDIRQISGYARLMNVYSNLSMETDTLIDCVIIYPDQKSKTELPEDFKLVPINKYNSVYKVGVALPILPIEKFVHVKS